MAARKSGTRRVAAAKHPSVVAPAPAAAAMTAAAAMMNTPTPSPQTIDEPVVALATATDDRPTEDMSIYTHADASVEPPVMVRPVLPREGPPGVLPENVGTMEVVVDEDGDVLGVRLISPANRYQDRMLVSAAKMWKFRPAYKDGRPVRYRTRVRLTI